LAYKAFTGINNRNQGIMAKFNCCYSGLEITTSHFPLYLSDRDNHQACHPIFYADQRKLLGYARKWSANELTPIDKYLLFVALLKSTDLVYFRTPCTYEEQRIEVENDRFILKSGSGKIVAQNMEKLLYTVSRINSVMNPRVRFPEIVITAQTASLYNVKHWIDNWNQVYEDYKAGATKQEKFAEQSQREQALHKLIKSPHRRIESYSAELAEWVSEAADFPLFNIKHPVTGEPTPLAEYYKEVIRYACAKEYFKIVNTADLREIIDLCADRIAFSIDKGQNAGGSIQSFLLFKVLDEAKLYLSSFIQSSKKPTVRIPISETWRFPDDEKNEPEEFAPGLSAIIASTPIAKPVQSDFSNKIAYITAKIKWDAANSARERASADAVKSTNSGNKTKGLSNDSLGF
jgi:hypothetical protein